MNKNYFGVNESFDLDSAQDAALTKTFMCVDLTVWIKHIFNVKGDCFIQESGVFTVGCVDPLPSTFASKLELLDKTAMEDAVGYTITALVQSYFDGIYHRVPEAEVLDSSRFLKVYTDSESLMPYLAKLLSDVERKIMKAHNRLINFSYRNSRLTIMVGEDWRVAAFLADRVEDVVKEYQDEEAGDIACYM